jgi:hypothetical protein
MVLYASFFRVYEFSKEVDHEHNNLRLEFEEEKSFQVLPQQTSYEMIVLNYCSPMEIQRALQEPHNATIDILAIVAAVDALGHTSYYPDEIREVTLMDDMYVSNMVFDGHEFIYFQCQYFSTLCTSLAFLRIMLPDPQISESMLISCGVDNKFVLAQNVMVD